MIHLCQQCGEPLPVRSGGRGRPPKYCSQECRDAAKRGYHNDPLYKRAGEPETVCCRTWFRTYNGKKGDECQQHKDNREVFQKWARQTQRQKRAGDPGDGHTGGQPRKARPTEGDKAIKDLLSAGHEYIVQDGGLGNTGKWGPNEGASTYYEDVYTAAYLNVAEGSLSRKAAMKPKWWNTVDLADKVAAMIKRSDIEREVEQLRWYMDISIARFDLEAEMAGRN